MFDSVARPVTTFDGSLLRALRSVLQVIRYFVNRDSLGRRSVLVNNKLTSAVFVRAADMGFLRPGQKAVVKLSFYLWWTGCFAGTY